MTSGMRQQRKNQTREALCAAAVEIVAADGLDALTADRIAEVAGVSRRTLFNYFARVEDVLTATMESATSEMIDAIVARPAEESLRTSALVVLEELIDSPVFTQARALERAAGRSVATRRFLLELDDRQRMALEEGLRRRLGADADELFVTSLAAAAYGVLCAVTRLAVASAEDDARAAELHKAWIRRGLDHLFAGFDESAAHATPAPAPASPES
jgi:AcrR family transcriptional regulator